MALGTGGALMLQINLESRLVDLRIMGPTHRRNQVNAVLWIVGTCSSVISTPISAVRNHPFDHHTGRGFHSLDRRHQMSPSSSKTLRSVPRCWNFSLAASKVAGNVLLRSTRASC
jgi:hypothetical protein